jgi:hypothetical protein
MGAHLLIDTVIEGSIVVIALAAELALYGLEQAGALGLVACKLRQAGALGLVACN